MGVDFRPLTYSSYLKVGELISLQKPLSEPPAHDEMLFIVVHQAYELWFKQVLFELDALLGHLGADRLIPSFRLFERIMEILKLLVQQIDILETMTPVEFNRFRSKLQPASGFQSWQFRELELVSGADASDYARFFDLEPEWKSGIQARAGRPDLRRVFLELLQRQTGKPVGSAEQTVDAILTVYQEEEKHLSLMRLCEYLLQYDEIIQLWRFRHVQMVERMIGMKTGTGGSLGVAYLRTTLEKRFFPELWQVRTRMNGKY